MKIELECEICGKKFLREKGEHNRNLKKGRKVYCSKSCNGKSKVNLDRLAAIDNTHLLNKGGDYRSDEYTPFRWHYNILVQNRQNKGVTISLHDIKELWELQGGICPFTMKKMELRTHATCREPLKPYHASLDRIDNEKGYEKGNVRFVSAMANVARQRWSDTELIQFCGLVTEAHL